MTRLLQKLSSSKSHNRGLLVGYLPAGFPDPQTFRNTIPQLFGAGLDALEVGLPGKVPNLDGPGIQNAIKQASKNTPSIDIALQLAAASRSSTSDPIIALAYQDTIQQITLPIFLQTLINHDVDAMLLPEHSVKDQLNAAIQAQAHNVTSVIFLHRQQDLALLASTQLRFPIIYLQSANLKTGGTFNPEKAQERLTELREALHNKPYAVLVGFGVRGPQQIRPIMQANADGAIIGSQLVAALNDSPQSAINLISDAHAALTIPPLL